MARWIRQYLSISRSAFVVTMGTPFSLVLVLTILGFLALLACLPTFTFGEQLRLIRDQSLALCFIGGCLASSLGAVKVISDDIRRGPASIIMSRPVGSFCYVAGKWTGVVASTVVIQVAAAIGTLWLTRITHSEQALDGVGLAFYLGAIAVALGVIGVKHYFLGGCYVWQANVALLVVFAAGFAMNLALGAGGETVRVVDWPTAQGSLLLIFALMLYTGVVTVLAVMADAGLVLSLSVVLFFAGLLSDYLVSVVFTWPSLQTVGRVLVPSWQLFWVTDLLAEGTRVPPGHIAGCGIHAVLYSAVMLVVATLLFERREIQGS